MIDMVVRHEDGLEPRKVDSRRRELTLHPFAGVEKIDRSVHDDRICGLRAPGLDARPAACAERHEDQPTPVIARLGHRRREQRQSGEQRGDRPDRAPPSHQNSNPARRP